GSCKVQERRPFSRRRGPVARRERKAVGQDPVLSARPPKGGENRGFTRGLVNLRVRRTSLSRNSGSRVCSLRLLLPSIAERLRDGHLTRGGGPPRQRESRFGKR